MKRNLLTLVSSLTLLLCATSSLFAQDKNPPEKMTFQGFLTDDTGVPYGNTAPVNQTITFKIFAAPTGDAPHLWGESQVVTIDKGHFSVLLGLGSEVGNRPPLYDVFTGVDASSRWMELTVGNKVVSPRIQFFAAPYAQLARVANELAPGASASEFKVDGLFTVSGNIEAESITGTSLNLGSGNINAGNITGVSLDMQSIEVGYAFYDKGIISTDGSIKSLGSKAGLSFSNRQQSDPYSIWTWSSRRSLYWDPNELKIYDWDIAELSNTQSEKTPKVVINAPLEAQSYTNISDARLKRVKGISSSSQDLEILKRIKIQDYEWINSKMGSDKEKKVVAQQVKSVFPQAVHFSGVHSSIPNINAKASEVNFDPSSLRLEIKMDKPHGLIVGDKIDFRSSGKDIRGKSILKINGECSFVVNSDHFYNEVFVIGKYVNDILTVDYDAIAMLNVSATQELARQAEELESRVRDLEARERRVALLEENLEAKMSRMEVFEKRLDALDKSLVSVSPQIDRNTEGLQVSVSTGSSR